MLRDRTELPPAGESDIEPLPYVRLGTVSGLLGAALVAAFFFVVDLAMGRPFATPNALGAALFLDEPLELSRSLQAPVIAAYTLAHGVAFVACNAMLFGLAWIGDVPIWNALGAGRIALANLVASAGMAILLVRGVRWNRARLRAALLAGRMAPDEMPVGVLRRENQ